MSSEFIVWEKKYENGINEIDLQHMQLVKLMNNLHEASLRPKEEMDTHFKTAIRACVDYINHHFRYEEDLMKKMNSLISGCMFNSTKNL